MKTNKITTYDGCLDPILTPYTPQLGRSTCGMWIDELNFDVKQERSREAMPRRENRGAGGSAQEFDIIPAKLVRPPKERTRSSSSE